MKPSDRVIVERERQITEEGWSAQHDDLYNKGDLAKAAACYAYVAGLNPIKRVVLKEDVAYAITNMPIIRSLWPWDPSWFKPTTPARDLEKAGALILAEMERLERNEDSDNRVS